MVPDMRPEEQIRDGLHAYARAYGRWHLVRGIDRFGYLPTREPAAMVWIREWSHSPAVLTLVALDDIHIHKEVVL